MKQTIALARWRAAAGPWAHFLKPSLLAVAEGVEPLAPAVADPRWKPEDSATAVVLDLPALESISIGVALGRQGWCVVPMFNTVHNPKRELIPTGDIIRALAGAAPELPESPSGPPVFLLDSGRMSSPKERRGGDFNNAWWVFSSDFPSAELLASRGISRLLVVSRDVGPKLDIRDAFVGHVALERLVVNPDDGRQSPFPAPRAAIWRGLTKFYMVLARRWDGSFGRRVSHG